MQLNRIKVCEDADQKLRHLRARLGLTPNLLCRIGFCLSLREPTIPDPNSYKNLSDREINRYTLTGQWDSLFIALLKERCQQDGLNHEDVLEEQFLAHINRGVLLLFQRVKHPGDLFRLIDEAQLNSSNILEEISK